MAAENFQGTLLSELILSEKTQRMENQKEMRTTGDPIANRLIISCGGYF